MVDKVQTGAGACAHKWLNENTIYVYIEHTIYIEDTIYIFNFFINLIQKY